MSEVAHSYKDLIVWQKAVDLVIAIYTVTDQFPKHEIYGLTSQMRRAAVSVPSSIAEGRRRKTRPDYHRFLDIAYGSGAELETQIIISKKLHFVHEEKFAVADGLLSEVMRMLNKMISSD
jgi:four helix bundle protein